MVTHNLLPAVVIFCLALFYDAVLVRAADFVEPVAVSNGNHLSSNELRPQYYYYNEGFRESLNSSYKYITLHNHRGLNCSKEIRFNATFQLDTCINGTFPWFHDIRSGDTVNSFSFYYNVNNTGYGLNDDAWMTLNTLYMISYLDDACTPDDSYYADSEWESRTAINCEHGFSYTASNELPPAPSAASYVK
jgi:hypothetical protein